MYTEQAIIAAIIGMVGLFSTAFVWQVSNNITYKYYGSGTHRLAD